MAESGDEIVTMCRGLGFALAGVCEARASDFTEHYRAWLARGEHGSMGYLARNVELRLDPRRLTPGARSIIMVADQYAARAGDHREDRAEPDAGAAPTGAIARYGQGRDYHVVMKKRLHRVCDALRARHPDEIFRAFVDTAPVLEREHAARAGLGWIGKHTLLINPQRGSWIFLGGILTTLDITTPTDQAPVADHCGSCTRCIDACPTGAISPYSVDARRCIAYLTIERRAPIDESFHENIGDRIFGCDACQEVCPHNAPRSGDSAVGAPNTAYASRRTGFDLLSLLAWDENDRREAFRATALKRATLAMMKRNAILALANITDPKERARARDRIAQLLHEEQEDPLIRGAAAAALRRLSE